MDLCFTTVQVVRPGMFTQSLDVNNKYSVIELKAGSNNLSIYSFAAQDEEISSSEDNYLLPLLQMLIKLFVTVLLSCFICICDLIGFVQGRFDEFF